MAQRAKYVGNNTYNVCNCIVTFSMILDSTPITNVITWNRCYVTNVTNVTNASIQKHETVTRDKGKKSK